MEDLKRLCEAVERLELSVEQLRREAIQGEYLTIPEAALFIGIKKEQMYELTAKKTFPLHKPGGKIALILKSDLKAWIEASRIPSAAEIERQTNSLLLKKRRA